MTTTQTLAPLLVVAFHEVVLTRQARARVDLNWGRVLRESHTSISMEVYVEPPMRRGRPIYDQLFQTLNQLDADPVRLSPWYPNPRLAVAGLEAPHDGETSWDFSLLDPVVADFMQATSGHSVDMNISTVPEGMFKTDCRLHIPPT